MISNGNMHANNARTLEFFKNNTAWFTILEFFLLFVRYLYQQRHYTCMASVIDMKHQVIRSETRNIYVMQNNPRHKDDKTSHKSSIIFEENRCRETSLERFWFRPLGYSVFPIFTREGMGDALVGFGKHYLNVACPLPFPQLANFFTWLLSWRLIFSNDPL